MGIEENKANAIRLSEEAWNKGNLDVIQELISPNFYFKDTLGREFRGVDGYTQMVVNWRVAFPDCTYTRELVIGEGEWVSILRPTEEPLTRSSDAGSFVLIPYSNRLRDGQFFFEGQEYQLRGREKHAIHGDVRDRACPEPPMDAPVFLSHVYMEQSSSDRLHG